MSFRPASAPALSAEEQKKASLLSREVKHIDFTAIDATPLVDSMREMSFTSRQIARAADIYTAMLNDSACSVFLTLAGSTSAGGCMQVYADLIRYNMVDAIVATGASIVDMDYFEALGFKHYIGSPDVDDRELRAHYIDRIHDTYIDEDDLQACDASLREIADRLPPRPYSSREFIREMGKGLSEGAAKKQGSLVQLAYEHGVPVFCPAFSDCSAGFGLVMHQVARPNAHMSIDSVKDFRELTDIKIKAGETGLLMVGGGVPKNFAQDTVVCAELLGVDVPMHKFAVQVTVADLRDGGCSGSTLKEACSWGKVDVTDEQMVYAEATTVMPLLASYAWRKANLKDRPRRRFADMFPV